MKRTGAAELLIAFFLFGSVTWLVFRFAYGSVPPLQYAVAVPITALAVAEFVMARRVRAAVRHDPHAKPMAAIAIARCVALGKASAIVAAGMLGAALAVLLRVVPDAKDVRAAASDEKVAIALGLAAILLLVAGLLLERAGIDPGAKDRQASG
jgi:hypothetical protein